MMGTPQAWRTGKTARILEVMQPATAPHPTNSTTVLGLPLRTTSDLGAWEPSFQVTQLADGLVLLTCELHGVDAVPPAWDLVLSLPASEVAGIWRSNAGTLRSLTPNWAAAAVTSKATSQAPVLSLLAQDDGNLLTLALDDALHPVTIDAGLIEESALIRCRIRLFHSARQPAACHRVTLRIDRRRIPVADALAAVTAWWAEQYVPLPVPDCGRRPMYSTWYAFHQKLDVDSVVAECRRARDLGCGAVIVDDGWQTNDAGRGYAFCGDWQPDRLPRMREFVDAVHATGLQFLLWYSVPFVGFRSAAWERFAGRCLRRDERMLAGVLDPRYPEVREYLIATYERAVVEWDLDGLKLDFVDSFHGDGNEPQGAVDGRDFADVDEAVDALLSAVVQRLRVLKPELLIEFRQGYVGPLMRTYGNLLRAGDCPGDAATNRLRTIDVRLLCGTTAAHADMLMWHPDEPVASAALQFLAVIFAVPQWSMRLDRLPADHLAMVRHLTAWWNEHRDVLLDGWLRPRQFLGGYALVEAGTATKRVVAVYGDVVAAPEAGIPGTLIVVNATRAERVVLELPEALGLRRVVVRDCCGTVASDTRLNLGAGLHHLAIPPAGCAEMVA
jgi:alpha-galactosidase